MPHIHFLLHSCVQIFHWCLWNDQEGSTVAVGHLSCKHSKKLPNRRLHSVLSVRQAFGVLWASTTGRWRGFTAAFLSFGLQTLISSFFSTLRYNFAKSQMPYSRIILYRASLQIQQLCPFTSTCHIHSESSEVSGEPFCNYPFCFSCQVRRCQCGVWLDVGWGSGRPGIKSPLSKQSWAGHPCSA